MKVFTFAEELMENLEKTPTMIKLLVSNKTYPNAYGASAMPLRACLIDNSGEKTVLQFTDMLNIFGKIPYIYLKRVFKQFMMVTITIDMKEYQKHPHYEYLVSAITSPEVIAGLTKIKEETYEDIKCFRESTVQDDFDENSIF